MAAVFDNIGNFNKEGTCHFCGNEGETLDITTTSELLQEVTMCLNCFSKIGRAPERNGARPTRGNKPRKQGRAAESAADKADSTTFAAPPAAELWDAASSPKAN